MGAECHSPVALATWKGRGRAGQAGGQDPHPPIRLSAVCSPFASFWDTKMKSPGSHPRSLGSPERCSWGGQALPNPMVQSPAGTGYILILACALAVGSGTVDLAGALPAPQGIGQHISLPDEQPGPGQVQLAVTPYASLAGTLPELTVSTGHYGGLWPVHTFRQHPQH